MAAVALNDTLFESKLSSLPLLRQGKVRDVYAVDDDKLLIVATDRLSAFDVVLHVQRYADGVPRVVAIEEVLGTRDGGFDTQPLFHYRGPGDDGGFAAAGVVPRFYADLDARGVTADPAIFRG